MIGASTGAASGNVPGEATATAGSEGVAVGQTRYAYLMDFGGHPVWIETIGTFVMGTVAGDIHDVGKKLCDVMLEGAGFEVIDLGINCDVDKYFAALEQHQPDILGMSALLTTTMPYMKVVIDTLKQKGLRDKYIVLVGGAPLNEEFARAIGADAYCRDAAVTAGGRPTVRPGSRIVAFGRRLGWPM